MKKFEEANWKYCPSCECVYPVDYFFKDENRIDKLRCSCKGCDASNSKKYHKEHPGYVGRIGICVACGEEKGIHSMGLCRGCYMKKYNQLPVAKTAKINYAESDIGKEARKRSLQKKLHSRRRAQEIIRIRALSFYSDNYMECKNCGYDNIDALSIDHIENNGKEERKKYGSGGGFYYWLSRNNYPEGYQVLCINCNWLKFLEYEDNRRGV